VKSTVLEASSVAPNVAQIAIDKLAQQSSVEVIIPAVEWLLDEFDDCNGK
jgi:hypothetical protein